MYYFSNLFSLGLSVTLISDIFRVLSFFLDGLIYSLIPIVYGVIYSLYDFSILFGGTDALAEIVNRMTTTVYSFLAIFMFFRVAFSLITMLIDPSVIDDKEKGAKKIVVNIMICLLLIVVVPKVFEQAKLIQARVLSDHWIEKVVLGDDFSADDSYSLGNEFALSVWGVFFHPVDADDDVVAAYNAVFNSGSSETAWPLANLMLHLNNVTGNSIISHIPLLNRLSSDTHYCLAYIYILSTIAGVYILWMFIKIMIDVAYRSLKFFALELLSPVAIISYIDPSSGKKGVFSKWLNETVKTYISLFIRIFVFAFAAVLLKSFALSEVDLSNGGFVNLIYILAIVAFIKTAPKFIDNLFGTSISKDSDTKFVSDMFRGIMGGAAIATTGAISGAYVAGKTGQNAVRGALSGGWTGFTKGYKAASKGNLPGVITSGFDTYSASKKKYGYEFNKDEERDLRAMEPHVANGKKAKNAAIAYADANNKEAIRKEFNRDGMSTRSVNGYDVKYSNLIGDANAEGAYKKYLATVAENSAIPGISEEGLNIYNNVAQRKMYAALSKMQSESANDTFNVEYSAFAQRDTAGREAALLDAFNAENARRASIGETVYTDWQTMFKDIGGLDASATLSVDSAYKIALDNKIKVETGHTTSEWANIAGKDEGDASAASDEVKRHEASSKGKADKRRKDLYSKAKGKLEAQNYKP